MSETSTKKHTAGAFDIRNVIGALLVIYGVILLVTRIVEGDQAGEKADAVNANLWAGLALLVVGLVFVVWARVRPVVVPEHTTTPEDLAPPSN